MKRIIITFLVIAACSIPSFAKYSGGSGTSTNPYQIATAADLNDIGNHTEDFNKYFIMTADINLAQYTGAQFNVIGTFKGIFDGNNHTISNFTYSLKYSSYKGVFGEIDSAQAQIKNVGMINPDVNIYSDAGSLIGAISYGSVSNCYVKGGKICGYEEIGGLIGANIDGKVQDCCSTCDIYCEGEKAGGLIGYSTGAVQRCSSSSAIYGSDMVGGLIGTIMISGNWTVKDSFATGPVKGYYIVGGLIGWADEGKVINCYATGDVNGRENTGGLFGDGGGAGDELLCHR